MMQLRGKTVMVVGMAKSGIASARLLLLKGALPVLYDMKPLSAFADGVLSEFEGKARFALGANASDAASDADMLVLSPGVPIDLDFIQDARRAGKPVIGEIELGFLFAKAQFVAITGTNGKTTTTALTGEIFINAGFSTYVLGNIGTPIAESAAKTRKGDIIVAETAALQLETIDRFLPHACTVLNITEDHLNRYGTMENYTAAKERVFENQTADDFCVLNYDNAITRGMADKPRSQIIWFSRQVEPQRGVFIKQGRLMCNEPTGILDLCGVDEVKIPGTHNIENAMAAAALARCYQIPADVIRDTLMTFPGVEHRIEFVREYQGVRYINDSKGTNPDATQKAADAMQRPTVLILGGYDKHSSFKELFEGFGPQIKTVIAIGETQRKIQSDAAAAGFDHVLTANGFEDAVRKAKDTAKNGWNVLLSPACASYDMFTDFEQRGSVFKSIVNSF